MRQSVGLLGWMQCVLTEADGFPKLGVFDIGLIRKPGKLSSAVEALVRHVQEGLGSQRLMMAAE